MTYGSRTRGSVANEVRKVGRRADVPLPAFWPRNGTGGALDATKEITLSSGGKAWAYRELLWSDYLRRIHFEANARPDAALTRMREYKQRLADEQGIQPGVDPEIVLTQEDINAAAAYSMELLVQELTISLERWENVRDPRTGEQLTFPEGIHRLGRSDAAELANGCREALREGVPDPNASGDQSSNDSAMTPLALIPSGRKTSRRRG